eukprot:scaffold60268_cov27-Tisochrysis_lutea.AAC.20
MATTRRKPGTGEQLTLTQAIQSLVDYGKDRPFCSWVKGGGWQHEGVATRCPTNQPTQVWGEER